VARVDYEAAWTDLLAYLAGKTSHGRSDVLVKAAELAEEHQVPEDLLEKAARLVGGPIQINRPEAQSSSSGDRRIDERMTEEPPATDDQGGHDGGKCRRGEGEPVRA
jgi:hypothetical protein